MDPSCEKKEYISIEVEGGSHAGKKSIEIVSLPPIYFDLCSSFSDFFYYMLVAVDTG